MIKRGFLKMGIIKACCSLVLRKSIGGRSSQGYLRVRVGVRVRFRVRVRLRVRVRRRLWVSVKFRVSFRVRARFRVRVRIRVFIKPIPLSRYHLARKGILFGVQPWRRV